MKQTLSVLMLVVLMLSGCVATVPVKGVVADQVIDRAKTKGPIEYEVCAPIKSWYEDQYSINGQLRRGSGALHNGFDMAASKGTSVIAPAPGVVITSRYEAVGGNVVWIYHGQDANGNHVFSGSGHLSERKVARGQIVKRGDLIGLSGDTGTGLGTEGAHLHFGVALISKSDYKFGEKNEGAIFGTVSPNTFLYPMRIDAEGKSIVPERFSKWNQSQDYGDKDWATDNRFYGLTFPVACQ